MNDSGDRVSVKQSVVFEIHVEELENGTYRAHEPDSPSDIEGRGRTAAEAIESYAKETRRQTEPQS